MLQDANSSFISVTEVAGELISKEQLLRLHHRYSWAASLTVGKDVLELGCGTAPGYSLLAGGAKSVTLSDRDPGLVEISRANASGESVLEFGAEAIPLKSNSFDAVIFFEAIYYIKDLSAALSEIARVLRPGGVLLVTLPNKDLYDFNPSPLSSVYYNAPELSKNMAEHGFDVQFFGYLDLGTVSIRQSILRPVKKAAVYLGIMPRTTAGKVWLKRCVFGVMIPMPAQLNGREFEYSSPEPIADDVLNSSHKVIYVLAELLKQ